MLTLPMQPRRELASDAPPSLTPRADCVAQVVGRWFVAEVQTNYEKAIAWQMVDLGLDYYLPLVERVKLYGGNQKRRKVVPLFANYLFAAGDNAELYCREHRNVLGIISVGDKSQRQLVGELSSLEIALYANPRLEVCDIHAVGQRVKVSGGPFEGAEGIVEDFLNQRGMCRVIVRVEILGKGTPLEIDKSDLQPL